MELPAFLHVSEDDWAAKPALRDAAKRWLKLLPAGLDDATVRGFYRKLWQLGPFRSFTATQRPEYFPAYAALRIEAAREAFANDVTEGFVSETAYLFGCRDEADMLGYSHVRRDDADRVAFLSRQKLVDAHQRHAAVPYFDPARFERLVDDAVLLDAARRTLANPWFLARAAHFDRSGGHPRFDPELWAACKYVLRLAGEAARAPGPEPERVAEPSD